jgi:hypothetical protein
MVTSNAENVISALIMIKWFNAVSDRVTILPPDHDRLYDTLASYFTTNARLETHVDLNEVNTANATRVFHETIKRMNCNPLAGGNRKLKRTKRIRNPRKPKTRKPRKQ